MDGAVKINVACPCGRVYATKVRGRGASCPACHRQTYVRADGSTKAGPPPKIDDSQSAETPKPVITKGVVKRGYQVPKDDTAKDSSGNGEKPKRANKTAANREPTDVHTANPATVNDGPDTRKRGGQGDSDSPPPGGQRGRRKIIVDGSHPYAGLFNW